MLSGLHSCSLSILALAASFPAFSPALGQQQLWSSSMIQYSIGLCEEGELQQYIEQNPHTAAAREGARADLFLVQHQPLFVHV